MGYVENPFKELGVPDNAPLEVCKTAYRKLMKQNHPDLGTEAEVSVREAKCARLNEAYRKIKEGYKVTAPVRKVGFTHKDLFNFIIR